MSTFILLRTYFLLIISPQNGGKYFVFKLIFRWISCCNSSKFVSVCKVCCNLQNKVLLLL